MIIIGQAAIKQEALFKPCTACQSTLYSDYILTKEDYKILKDLGKKEVEFSVYPLRCDNCDLSLAQNFQKHLL